MINIHFASGRETWRRRDRGLRGEPSLPHRLAVIQDSYVERGRDMTFDPAVWERLAAFVSSYAPDATLHVVQPDESLGAPDLRTLESFLATWGRLTLAEKDGSGPPAIVCRENGSLRLFIAPEHWAAVGGPYPYHDSYAYLVCSDRDLSEALPAYMAAAPPELSWAVHPEVVPGSEPPGKAQPWWTFLWRPVAGVEPDLLWFMRILLVAGGLSLAALVAPLVAGSLSLITRLALPSALLPSLVVVMMSGMAATHAARASVLLRRGGWTDRQSGLWVRSSERPVLFWSSAAIGIVGTLICLGVAGFMLFVAFGGLS